MRSPEPEITAIVSVPFEENCYVARWPDRSDCLVVDPGLEPDKIVEYLNQHQLTPAAILNTHGHSDHIAGNGSLKAHWPDCPLVIGSIDAAKLTDPQLNLSAAFGVGLVSPEADETVDDGDTRQLAGFSLKVFAIPGHSAGHVVYLIENNEQPIVFVGDVIFSGSIGRHDFPDGNFKALRDGIHQKLFTLSDDTVLLPGHGPATTVGIEKRTNPFVGVGG